MLKRLWAFTRRSSRVLALTLLFLLAMLTGLALHIDLPPGRRFVATQVEGVLNRTFLGRFELSGISHLSLRSGDVSRVVIRAPSGEAVIVADGLRVRADVWSLLVSILEDTPRSTLVIDYARAERAEVKLTPDRETGDPTLVSAFELRDTTPGVPSKKEIRVWMPALELGQGKVSGAMLGAGVEGRASSAHGRVLVSPVGVAVDVPRFAASMKGVLSQEIRGIASFHERGTRSFYGTFDGYAGDLQVNSVMRLEGRKLRGTVDVPRADPKSVLALYPAWPVLEPLSLHVAAKGDIEDIGLTGTVLAGKAEVAFSGELRPREQPVLMLDVAGQNLDLRSVLEGAPESQIEAHAVLGVWTGETTTVDVTGSTQPTVLAGEEVPALEVAGSYDEQGFNARVEAHEPGMPFTANVLISPEGAIEGTADVPRFRIEAAPRIAAFLPLRGVASGKVSGRFAKGEVDASVNADLTELTLGAISVTRARVTGSLRGDVQDAGRLAIDAKTEAQGVLAGAFRFEGLSGSVRGPAREPHITVALENEQGLNVKAETKLRSLAETVLHDVRIGVSRAGAELRARATRIALAEGHIEGRGLVIEGAGGNLTGSGNYRPGFLELEARGDGLDLGTIANVLGLAPETLDGRVSLHADVIAARDVRRGRVHFEVHDGRFRGLPKTNLDLGATLDGTRLEADAEGSVDKLGKFRLNFDGELSGEALTADAFRNATGKAELLVTSLALAELERFIPTESGIEALSGVAGVQLTLGRTKPGEIPSAALVASTESLALTFTPPESGAAPIVVTGMDAELGGSFDGRNGVTEASLRVVDAQGLLASATGRMEIEPESVFEPKELLRNLTERPIALTAAMNGRSLATLPEPIRPGVVTGTLSAEANLRGTLAAPVLSGKAQLRGAVVGDALNSTPVDACGRAQYDPVTQDFGFGAEIHLHAASRPVCGGQRVVLASANGTLDLDALEPGKRPFVGDARLGFEDLPLSVITSLSDAGVRGSVRGAVALALAQGEGLPQITAGLVLRDTALDRIKVGNGRFTLRSDGKQLVAGAVFDRDPGELVAELRSALAWDGMLPSFDPASPIHANVRAEGVDAVMLEPMLSDVLSDLSGRLDGNVAIALQPKNAAAPDAPREGSFSGKLAMRDGQLQFTGLGMRLSQVSFSAETKTVGRRTTVAVRGLSAASRAKYLNVAASADLYLRGLELEGARANVNLRQVPFLLAGVSQATLTGSSRVKLERKPDRVTATIDLPRLIVDLPRSTARNVLSTEANRNIEILQPIAEPRRRSDEQPIPWDLRFVLGNDVKVTRADLNIPVRGNPVVTLAEDVGVSGDLVLPQGGRVQLLGKAFVVESGEVHFDTGDATNPHVRVLASWRAPDSTIIYVEVSGTLREAALRLDSDPARSQAEIQALLFGGGTGEGGDAQAAGIGYGADFLGELLADTPLRRVELRTASEQTADDRYYSTYTAAVQISDEIWFEGSYKDLNSSDPAEQQEAFSGTIDWRFRENWSLRTEGGTIGTGIDLLWQYRY
jgi:autotransporter translocation and assembly factor TamB